VNEVTDTSAYASTAAIIVWESKAVQSRNIYSKRFGFCRHAAFIPNRLFGHWRFDSPVGLILPQTPEPVFFCPIESDINNGVHLPTINAMPFVQRLALQNYRANREPIIPDQAFPPEELPGRLASAHARYGNPKVS
jgi:hypothetical protein